MKFTCLGQNGLLFELCGKTVMTDPYLSDQLSKKNSEHFRRMVPVDTRFLEIRPDILILTHVHEDHTDDETLDIILGNNENILILCPKSVFEHLRSRYIYKHRMVQLDRGTEWTEKTDAGCIHFTGIYAAHSDPYAVGVYIDSADGSAYISGDTLFSKQIVSDILACGDPDTVFVCINGAGNNMNMTDAARFARLSGAACAVPVHWGMMDDIDPQAFEFENRYIPEVYKEFEV